MSERTPEQPLPLGQIFFDNKWARVATAVLGLSTPFHPACANQPAIVQPASASETTPYPDYQINLSEGWVKGTGIFSGNGHLFFSSKESSAIVGKITLGQTTSPEAEAQRVRSTLSEQVQVIREDGLNIEYLMENTRTIQRFARDNKGQVIIIEVIIPSGLVTAYQRETLEFLNAIH